MNAERINPDSSAEQAAALPQPETAGAFRVPLPAEAKPVTGGGERKSKRKRKKNKKSGDQPTASHVEDSKPTKPRQEHANLLTFDQGELWKREEDTPKSRASAELGKKVLTVAEQASLEPQATEAKPDVEAGKRPETASQVDAEPTQIVESETTKAETPTERPKSAEADATSVEDEPDTPELPIMQWTRQPEQQHQAAPTGEEPAEDVPVQMPEVMQQPEVVAPRGPNPFEQSYEPVQAPVQPPDPMSYRRRFWDEPPAAPDILPNAYSTEALPPIQQYEALPQEPDYYSHNSPLHTEAPAEVPLVRSGKYESDTPPGYQRNTSDVRRAAATGLFAGWWLGRRGKRKAVEQARKSGIQEGVSQARSQQPAMERRRSSETLPWPHLEAEPIHAYPTPEGSRTVIQPLSVESRDRVRPPEQTPNAVTRVAEQLAAPIAAIAVFDRAINRSALERVEVPRTIKIAAAKAAESVITKPVAERLPEAAPGARPERHLGKRELLQVAKDIKVDGVPLKDIYKAKKIDDVGLRNVVNTYLRGGDIRQQLAHEVVVKEQSYERDPVVRHYRLGERKPSTRSGRTSDNDSGPGGSVGQTIGNALGAVAATTENTARSAGRALASGAKTAQRDLIDNSNTTDWLSITAVVVLYSIILLLLLT